MAKKIMIVDDEENLLLLVKEILQSKGFDVTTSQSGSDCLKKLKTLKPDLILLDMMMPKMSGYDVLKEIRKNPKTKSIKVVFLTVARISEDSMFKLGQLNIEDYITKPFDNDELVERVKKALQK